MFPSASELQRFDREVPQAARLDFAPGTSDLRAPARASWRAAGLTWTLASATAAGFAAAFSLFWLLSARALPEPGEIPVEIVAKLPGTGSGQGSSGAARSPSAAPAAAPAASPDAGPKQLAPGLPEHANESAPPKLVEPPPEPAPADKPRAAVGRDPAASPGPPAPVEPKPVEPKPAAPKPADPKPAGPVAPAVPKVLATADRKVAAAVPAPQPRAVPQPKPGPAPPDAAGRNADTFAAAFPTGIQNLPLTFQAALSSRGPQESSEYKGLIFGRLGRDGDLQARAQARQLHGRVLVSFSVDDAGAIANLVVLQSSGKPEVDAIALDMVRAAGPFPPPPAGAQRDFTPVLIIGE